MKEPAYVPLYADRFTAFSRTLVIGYDLRNRELRAQVRKTRNATGTPLADLRWNGATNFLRGMIIGATESRVQMTISKDTILAMTSSLLVNNQDVEYVYDVLIKNADGSEEVLFGGPFIIRAGVSQ